jgi:dGTP triphosphohydrolase
MKSTDKLNKVRALLGLEVQLEERMLENGTRFEADAFEAGKEVFIVTDEDERIAVPSGEYLLQDGMMLVVEEDGIIAEMKESVEEEVEEVVEAPVVEEVEAAEVADIEDWRGLEIRVKNLEDAIADLKADKESKVEASEIEVNDEVELSAIKHNPESKNEVEHRSYAQNRPMNTQDRVFARLFNNN